MHDDIEHPVVQQELRGLKSLGQILPERLFDHSWSGEPDYSSRLCEDCIAKHGVAGADATRRWIRQDRHIWNAPFAELRRLVRS